MAEERFIRVYKQGGAMSSRKEIWVDRETGVNYLWAADGYAGGLTPLMGRDGKPVITTVER